LSASWRAEGADTRAAERLWGLEDVAGIRRAKSSRALWRGPQADTNKNKKQRIYFDNGLFPPGASRACCPFAGAAAFRDIPGTTQQPQWETMVAGKLVAGKFESDSLIGAHQVEAHSQM
jgi:hypothetical protein